MQSFRRDATFAWTSNIYQRKASLDPDYFDAELSRTNSARIHLNRRFDDLLKQLGPFLNDSDKNPIFLTILDDFDLSPTASLQTLKMLRMLNLRRMFFLLVGDFPLLEFISDLNQISEMTSAFSFKEGLKGFGLQSSSIIKTAGAISRSGLRKLIPPAQRIKLKTPTVLEGMGHFPQFIHKSEQRAGNTAILADLFLNLPISIEGFRPVTNSKGKELSQKICGIDSRNLMDFLLHPGFDVFDSSNGPERVLNCSTRIEETLKQICQDTDKEEERISFLELAKKTSSEEIFLLDWSESGEPERGQFQINIPRYPRHSNFPRHSNLKFQIPTCQKLDAKRGMQDLENQEGLLTQTCFWAIKLFANNPRRLNDLWFQLRSLVARLNRDLSRENEVDIKLIEKELLEIFKNTCRDQMLEETVFDSEEKEKIEAAMTPTELMDFNWSDLPLKIVSVSGPPKIFSFQRGWSRSRLRIPMDNQVVRNLHGEIRAFEIQDWAIVAESQRARFGANETQTSQEFDPARQVSSSTASAMIIFHDLLRIGTFGKRFQSNLIPADDGTWEMHESKLSVSRQAIKGAAAKEQTTREAEDDQDDRSVKSGQNNNGGFKPQLQELEPVWCKWASTRFQGSHEKYQDLYWPPPSVASLWGLDIFRRSWNRTIEYANEISDAVKQAESLAFGWISAGCAVLTGNKVDVCSSNQGPTQDDWFKIFLRLNYIAAYSDQDNIQHALKHACRNWLQNVAIMLMPESGLPSHLMFTVLFGLKVKRFDIDDAKLRLVGPVQRLKELNKLKYLNYLDQIKRQLVPIEFCDKKFYYRVPELFKLMQDQGSKDIGINWDWANHKLIPNNVLFREISQIYSEFLNTESKVLEECQTDFIAQASEATGDDERFHHSDWFKPGRDPKSVIGFSRRFETLTENRDEAEIKAVSRRIDSYMTTVWMRKFPWIDFLNQNATEIRARRGIRLGMLGEVASGGLSKRLLDSCIFHLSSSLNRKQLFTRSRLTKYFPDEVLMDQFPQFSSDSMSGRELFENRKIKAIPNEPQDLLAGLIGPKLESMEKKLNKKEHERDELYFNMQLVFVGDVFHGGGLIPHPDEICGYGATWLNNQNPDVANDVADGNEIVTLLTVGTTKKKASKKKASKKKTR